MRIRRNQYSPTMYIQLVVPADACTKLHLILTDLAKQAKFGRIHALKYEGVEMELIDFPKYFCEECGEYCDEYKHTTKTYPPTASGQDAPETTTYCPHCGAKDSMEKVQG